ncbi:hypothetical protein HQ520_19095, partial [bacterium]|nr:hypothetical protein [bacterium]
MKVKRGCEKSFLGGAVLFFVFVSLICLALLPGTANAFIIDNSDDELTSPTGPWPVSSGVPGFYGPNYQYHNASNPDQVFIWRLTEAAIPEPGWYEIHGRWSADPNRASNAWYQIYHDKGFDAAIVNQRENGGEWILFGTWYFDGVEDSVTL